jgi:hypothetical protein
VTPGGKSTRVAGCLPEVLDRAATRLGDGDGGGADQRLYAATARGEALPAAKMVVLRRGEWRRGGPHRGPTRLVAPVDLSTAWGGGSDQTPADGSSARENGACTGFQLCEQERSMDLAGEHH